MFDALLKDRLRLFHNFPDNLGGRLLLLDHGGNLTGQEAALFIVALLYRTGAVRQ